MKTTTLHLVSFGSARALTKDGLGTEFLEVMIQNGKYPALG